MLERIQFSKNLQIAIRAAKLLTGEMLEIETTGMFLDAVCRDNFNEALMRADENNKVALTAKDFTVAKFMFIAPDKDGYITGETYYLKIKISNGSIHITPNAITDANELTYSNFRVFLYDWKIK